MQSGHRRRSDATIFVYLICSAGGVRRAVARYKLYFRLNVTYKLYRITLKPENKEEQNDSNDDFLRNSST